MRLARNILDRSLQMISLVPVHLPLAPAHPGHPFAGLLCSHSIPWCCCCQKMVRLRLDQTHPKQTPASRLQCVYPVHCHMLLCIMDPLHAALGCVFPGACDDHLIACCASPWMLFACGCRTEQLIVTKAENAAVHRLLCQCRLLYTLAPVVLAPWHVRTLRCVERSEKRNGAGEFAHCHEPRIIVE
jgi:hypothetical protein